jgi:hypothetical protein
MTITILSFTLMLTVFISYILFIWIKYGILPSISESYYRLPDKLKFLFTFFCWGFAIPTIIASDNLLMFIAGSGIAFVGTAAQFKERITNNVHTIGAVIGVGFSQLSTYFDFHMLYVNIIFISLAAIILLLNKLKMVNNKVWWIELLAFSLMCYVLGIKIFSNSVTF